MNTVAAKLIAEDRWIFVLISAAILFLYSPVIVNLARQWRDDDNYSHGLLIPFLIALIIWQRWESMKERVTAPAPALGGAIIFLAFGLLLAGTLGAELFSQRTSLLALLSGVIVYFWGHRVLGYLSVPFLLLLLAIPIPQIILNKVSFPLQLLATRAADAGITFFGISSTRKGNVIELIPYGSTAPVGIEVVEACSGIRSLVTLITLSVVLAYFLRTSKASEEGRASILQNRDLWRGVVLVLLTVPIALISNAARVLLTGLATYQFGAGVADSWWHDAFGWLTFLIAVLLLLALNVFLAKFLRNAPPAPEFQVSKIFNADVKSAPRIQGVVLFLFLLGGGALINWFQMRTEVPIERKALSELPVKLGDAYRPYEDSRFSPATEEVLGATDYIMRDYVLPPRRFNLYVGYYGSKRTGATYHSPQHCLPGSGWEMSDGERIEFSTAAGRQIVANRYIVRNGRTRSVMIYWYQSGGRANASEFWDKVHTIATSISKGRSDGAMIRIMTPIYEMESVADAFEATESFSKTVADSLSEYVPD